MCQSGRRNAERTVKRMIVPIDECGDRQNKGEFGERFLFQIRYMGDIISPEAIEKTRDFFRWLKNNSGGNHICCMYGWNRICCSME